MKEAFEAEATALSYAIQVANQLGVGPVTFETDCINLKSALTMNDLDLAPLGALIKDMKFYLRLNFTQASVVYAPCACNRHAHELAALGIGFFFDKRCFIT
jgi:hypothetical protein